MKIKKNPTTRKKLIIYILPVVVAILCYIAVSCILNVWPFPQTSKPLESSTRDINSVDYSGPTEDDTSNSQKAKERLLNEDNDQVSSEGSTTTSPDTAQPETDKKSAVVGISYADIYNNQLEIRAFTSSVIQGTGTCTATVSKAGNKPITKTSKAFVDTSSSICRPIYIPRDQLSSGTWSITVTYDSPTHHGSSNANVEVN